jgi:hypothetical protein
MIIMTPRWYTLDGSSSCAAAQIASCVSEPPSKCSSPSSACAPLPGRRPAVPGRGGMPEDTGPPPPPPLLP